MATSPCRATVLPRPVYLLGGGVALVAVWLGAITWMRDLERSAPFAAEKWISNPGDRWRMARDWVRMHASNATNAQQVISMLGAPDMNYAPRYGFAELIYYIGPNDDDEQVLTIDFDSPMEMRFEITQIGLDDW